MSVVGITDKETYLTDGEIAEFDVGVLPQK
jgi:hypothetical protein